jgi:putative transposase
MANFRRYYSPNSYVFITSITKDRMPLLESTKNINLFFETMNNVKSLYVFDLFAFVLLKDHFHWILHIPDDVGNFSKVIQSFKRNFTLNYKHFHKIDHSYTVWQSRFWDHVIGNEKDLMIHLDYIHINPVKHQLVKNTNSYPYSSFRKFLDEGVYSKEWGGVENLESVKSFDFE